MAIRADPDVNSDRWKDRLRETLRRDDVNALKALVAEADLSRLTPVMLAWLGGNYLVDHEEGLELLRKAQSRYPTDFWVKYNLASALDRRARKGSRGPPPAPGPAHTGRGS